MMATGLKQLPSAVDQMALPDVWELFEHWTEWPPEHVLLRGFTGYEAPPRVTSPVRKIDPETTKGLNKFLGSGLVAGEKPPAHIYELVKWAEQMQKQLGVTVGES
jgi:hypothetical protein